MRFPYQRLAYMFDALQSETLPQEELAKRFAVSTRTVRADITALNEILEHYGAHFVHNRGFGYRLMVEDADRFRSLQQQNRKVHLTPRTANERVHYLLIRFLTSAFSLKLEDLADEWFVSRGTLQNDMAEVRERLNRYHLTIETKPRYGMKLFGSELAIRTCLTDLLFQLQLQDADNPLLKNEFLSIQTIPELTRLLHELLAQYAVRLTDEGEQYLIFYCAVAIKRITDGYPLSDFDAEDVDEAVKLASGRLATELNLLSGKDISAAEEAYLRVNIAARRVQASQLNTSRPSEINADDEETLVDYILSYINAHYNYNLQGDKQLRVDLLTHIKTMITRVKYQITIPNPLLSNIKQHYPMAYDVTLAAVSSWGKYTPYSLSENEIGYLVLHIGVGLERHYNIGYQRHPQVMLVCDTGNSTTRMIQAQISRKYPQIVMTQTISLRDYENLDHIDEDFIISNSRLTEKNKPVVVMSPFPTEYQLEQLGKLVLVDRTRPYMLEKFFDSQHFMIIDQPMTQEQLFKKVCSQLEEEDFVDGDFYPSVVEREAIVSTMLGEGIALPHSLGLLAKKTVVVTLLAPNGIAWGDGEVAHVIFLLAISKTDYEEAMAIYDLFVTFVRERSMSRLLSSQHFDSFKAIAIDCLSRI
ncbi:BglG family transcription antiterminator [Yersinia enterocolitica]|uniref:BglG family transcription antiterminator n=1 Tax=Yersinia enterocolitica TaxID=630 RepID=UPI00031CC010|nr:PRD domain-containing protein [Yersinia enterocolitica]EKN6262021.1 PRD domain-containing protein [Yersinia enterocolitica]HEF7270164.1 BglG family transcription antiterminator [Yersinia enterocolitica]HEI6724428.1 BglG family transcription antiterminator [Yersinia enterocolitica]HEI6760345.1 BglG family transcription antiterminator [Yersinia enterocolitica]HEI6824944.1 BglG family transcription antiterminator [Yersinia enterocolitica]